MVSRDVLEVHKSVIYDPMGYGGPLDPQSKYWSDFGPFLGPILKAYSLVERKIHPYTVNIFAPNSPDGFHDAITRRFECQKSTGGLWGGPVPPRVKIGPIFRISDRFWTIFKSIFTRRAKARPTYRDYVRTKTLQMASMMQLQGVLSVRIQLGAYGVALYLPE